MFEPRAALDQRLPVVRMEKVLATDEVMLTRKIGYEFRLSIANQLFSENFSFEG